MEQDSNNRRYLVCIDARKECRVALRLACMKAKSRSGKITLIHVVPPIDFQTLGGIADRMRVERLREGEELLSNLSNEAQESFGISPTLLLLEGNAGEKIVETAMGDHNYVFIILGVTQQQHTHQSKLSAWLAGQLNNTLFVPILLVPGNLTDQQILSLV